MYDICDYPCDFKLLQLFCWTASLLMSNGIFLPILKAIY